MAVNKRLLILNTSVSYLRTLLSVCLGLFTTRWVMAALGAQDYGLYFLVGGLVSFIAFINMALASGAHRYFSHSMDVGLNEVRVWFTASFLLHAASALAVVVLSMLAYFLAFKYCFAIPADRLLACKIVYWCAIVTTFGGIVNVPFVAMYTAKQRIFELTIIQMVNMIFLVGLAYAMLSVPGDRLIFYSLVIMGTQVLIYSVQAVRSFCAFPEARLISLKCISKSHFRAMLTFSWWKFVDAFAFAARGQGIQMLFNRFGSLGLNASFSVANQLACQTNVLSSAVNSALSPGIIAQYGAGDVRGAGIWCVRMCKIATVLATVTFVPIFAESEYVVKIWLGHPPESCAMFVRVMAIMFLVTQFVTGGNTLILAKGDIGAYERRVSACYIMGLVIAGMMMLCGFSAQWMIYSFVLSTLGYALVTIVEACRISGFGFVAWSKSVLFGGGCLVAIGLAFSCLLQSLFVPSLIRLGLLVLGNSLLTLCLAFFFLFSQVERHYVLGKVRVKFEKFGLIR